MATQCPTCGDEMVDVVRSQPRLVTYCLRCGTLYQFSLGNETTLVPGRTYVVQELTAACRKALAFDWKSGEGAAEVYDALRSALARAESST